VGCEHGAGSSIYLIFDAHSTFIFVKKDPVYSGMVQDMKVLVVNLIINVGVTRV
jgi:hypothetical protein